MGGTAPVVVDPLLGWCALLGSGQSGLGAGVGIAVESREVRRGDLESDPVARAQSDTDRPEIRPDIAETEGRLLRSVSENGERLEAHDAVHRLRHLGIEQRRLREHIHLYHPP